MKSEKSTDWLTPGPLPTGIQITVTTKAEMAAKRKRREKELKVLYAGTIAMLKKRAATSRKWLERRGWRLVQHEPRTESLWVMGAKVEGGANKATFFPHHTTAAEKCSLSIFDAASAAAHCAENEDWMAALHFSYVAGFQHGRSNARFLQQERNKRGGRRSPMRTEALERLAKLERKVGPRLAGVRRDHVIRADPWFERLTKVQFRQILRAFRKA